MLLNGIIPGKIAQIEGYFPYAPLGKNKMLKSSASFELAKT
jgi:hypothetical protein